MKQVITPAQMQNILDAFGDCSAMYECESISSLLRNYNNSEENIADWVDTQLRIEDAIGTPTKMLEEIKLRLADVRWLQKPTTCEPICLHNQSVFNPEKWNYTHVVYLTNGACLFAIVHDVPSDLKPLADKIANQENVAIDTMHEILPSGEIVQELTMQSGRYLRFIAHSTAQTKRRSLVSPIELTAAVI